jgi:16S rRNA (adenine1518-N6/adenine1519-N6)-dimethyltransferase
MFQKEVARRITAGHGNKEYGILSVLIQAFFNAEYLFEVSETSFRPPPKVKSAVIRLEKKEHPASITDESIFFKVVKAGFGQRRKTLRNSLSQWKVPLANASGEVLERRAEQLSR